MTFLPAEFYRQVEATMPIACVDFVLVRFTEEGREVGLIRRESPYGQVWCHLGGRIQRGETIVEALQRHSRETLEVETDAAPNRQPVYVYEWFPSGLAPADGTRHGDDERKYSIGLSFVVEFRGTPVARGGALDLSWFPVEQLRADMRPGSSVLVEKLLRCS